MVVCNDCKVKYNIKKCSICSICSKNNFITYLCPQDYKKSVKRAKKDFLPDGDCICFDCWIINDLEV